MTLRDIRDFTPVASIGHMQPRGWMVVHLPTNFYATGGPSTKRGTLLDEPAIVRFTPVVWHWDYGDGSSTDARSPGASWAAQSAREFDPTPTSHSFAAAGKYVIQLTVGYRAEYQFADSGWLPVAGILAIDAPPLTATAESASTVLVARDCAANPRGPGC